MSEHRRRVTREVLRLAPARRLCVFGAGNCNDVDLVQLRHGFDEIHLVDVDGEALAAGIERQGLSMDTGIVPHGVEIAGFSRLGPAFRVSTDLPKLSNVLRTHRHDFRETSLLPTCDVVVSCCTLSQLIGTLAHLLDGDHPRFNELAFDLREAHLELLLEQTLDGGSVLLISDMVSSETAPELFNCPDLALAKLRDDLISRNNYFHGTNPRTIELYLNSAKSWRTSIERRFPWRWTIGSRVFLVTALRVQCWRSPSAAGG